MHNTIKKVSEDVENRFSLNTAIAAIMELVNETYHYLDKVTPERQNKGVLKEALENLLLLLAPFAPHITDELWQQTGHNDSIHGQPWPKWDQTALKAEELTIVVQVNGKVRDRLVVPANSSGKEVEQLALQAPRVQPQLENKQVVRVINVPGRLVNIVVRDQL